MQPSVHAYQWYLLSDGWQDFGWGNRLPERAFKSNYFDERCTNKNLHSKRLNEQTSRSNIRCASFLNRSYLFGNIGYLLEWKKFQKSHVKEELAQLARLTKFKTSKPR
jgi:hypothetical protein